LLDKKFAWADSGADIVRSSLKSCQTQPSRQRRPSFTSTSTALQVPNIIHYARIAVFRYGLASSVEEGLRDSPIWGQTANIDFLSE
jgi:hypothetical protein